MNNSKRARNNDKSHSRSSNDYNANYSSISELSDHQSVQDPPMTLHSPHRLQTLNEPISRQISRRNAVKDFTFNFEEVKKQEMAEAAQKRSSKFVIDLEGMFKSVWDISSLLMLILTFLYIPVRSSVLSDSEPGSLSVVFEWAMDLFFFLDILLNFITPQDDGEKMRYRHREIACLYLKKWFWLDLISVLPMEEIIRQFISTDSNIIHYSKTLKLLKSIRLLKLFRAFRLGRQEVGFLSRALARVPRGSVVRDIILPFTFILMSFHLFACLWYNVGVFDNNPESWVGLKMLVDEQPLDLYIYCLYFVIQTFTTVGYGDIPSSRNLEISIRSIYMIAGVIIYADFTGKVMEHVWSLVSRSEAEIKIKESLDNIEKGKYVPRILIERVRRAKLAEVGPAPEDSEDEKLYLGAWDREESEVFFYKKFIVDYGHIPFVQVRKNDEIFVLMFGKALRPRYYKRGDVIYMRGESPASFYLVNNGEIGFMGFAFDTVALFKVGKGGYFGEHELFEKKRQREYSVTALTDCTLYSILEEDFHRLFVQDRKDWRAFNERFREYCGKRHEKIYLALEKFNREKEQKVYFEILEHQQKKGNLKVSRPTLNFELEQPAIYSSPDHEYKPVKMDSIRNEEISNKLEYMDSGRKEDKGDEKKKKGKDKNSRTAEPSGKKNRGRQNGSDVKEEDQKSYSSGMGNHQGVNRRLDYDEGDRNQQARNTSNFTLVINATQMILQNPQPPMKVKPAKVQTKKQANKVKNPKK